MAEICVSTIVRRETVAVYRQVGVLRKGGQSCGPLPTLLYNSSMERRISAAHDFNSVELLYIGECGKCGKCAGAVTLRDR